MNAEPNVTSCSGVTCDPADEALWDLGQLDTGESRTITVDALVDATVLSGNLIATTVRVTAMGLGDTINLLKVVAVYNTPSNTPSADLALSSPTDQTSGVPTDPVIPDQTFIYHLDFGNTSAGDLNNLQLRASLPAGVTVDSISDGGTEVNTGEIVWDAASLGALGAGASLQREVTVTADGAIAGDILKLRAELTHDGGLELDNTAEFAVSVAASASPLSVVITATPDPVTSGGSLFYTITVTNDSALPVDAVDVMFRVPFELSFDEADAEPNVTSCSGVTCDQADEAVFSLGTILAGESHQGITISATVAAGLDSGNLISVPIRVTATNMGDTINLQHTTVIQN